MLVVGLSGGIAAGKSTATRQLIGLGIPVIDCDRVAHDTACKGAWGYRRIVAAFGPGILTETGDIDRARLGQLVFADAAARRRLNKATHAPVAVELLRQLLGHWLCFRRLVVIDMPLLFETGTYKLASSNVVVACRPELQLQRVMLRDSCSAADAKARIAAQMPLERKMQLADVVLENDSSLEQLQEQVLELVATLRKKSQSMKHWLLSPAGVAAGLLGVVLLGRAAWQSVR
uniref:Dephospho-CoA kinase n=1 Tax=Tetradesmus obliquus TaxID=3088 RepID=A0A383VGM4_TETOB|eukprot:jgi/Sobl393_1/537/SZX64705.1